MSILSRYMLATILAITTPAVIAFGFRKILQSTVPRFRTSSYDLARGQKIFATRCARCHEVAAFAIGGQGPNLSHIAEQAPHRREGYTATAYLFESLVSPEAFKAPGSTGEMPRNLVAGLSADNLRTLLAYLLSLGGQPRDKEIAELDIPTMYGDEEAETFHFSREQVEQGEALFRGEGGCVKCHNFSRGPEWEHDGPSLFFGGHRAMERIREGITAPNADILAPFGEISLPLSSGIVVQGRPIGHNNSHVRLMTRDAKGGSRVESFAKSEIELEETDAGVPKTSPMPANYGKTLTEVELEALISFIRALN